MDSRGEVFVMEQEVINVHGLTNEFLNDKPIFSQVVDEFIDFIRGANLVIHNAKFDVGFMNHEFSLLNFAERSRHKVPMTEDICTVTDTLKTSKDEFGSPKTLDYLARFYKVDKLIDRTYHGALIDAQLLAFVYIEMTRKQSTFNLSVGDNSGGDAKEIRRLSKDRKKLKVIAATVDEKEAHKERLAVVKQKGGEPLWKLPSY
jgi:DNA polymerase-3 subunit epsilon